MATVNEPQDDDLRAPLREYIKLGFDNINTRLDEAQRERAVLKSDIDRIDGRIDRLTDELRFAMIGATVVLSAAIIASQ